MTKLVQLDEEQFNATFVEPMQRVGEDDEFEAISLKEYVTTCIVDLGLAVTTEDIQIQHVYINGNETFCHVLFYYGEPNKYLVIVTDYQKKKIHGHHILDLNEKYGLTDAK